MTALITSTRNFQFTDKIYFCISLIFGQNDRGQKSTEFSWWGALTAVIWVGQVHGRVLLSTIFNKKQVLVAIKRLTVKEFKWLLQSRWCIQILRVHQKSSHQNLIMTLEIQAREWRNWSMKHSWTTTLTFNKCNTRNAIPFCYFPFLGQEVR